MTHSTAAVRLVFLVFLAALGCLSCGTSRTSVKGDAAVVDVPGADSGRDLSEVEVPASDGGSLEVAIGCGGNLTTETNDKSVGAACTAGHAEVPACGPFPFFCTQRVLDDRWPQNVAGHCSRHCQSNADCGAGATCCEPRPGKFCMTNMTGRPELTVTSCAKPCPSNEECGPNQLCCEELGRICILNQCTGACPTP